MSWGLRGGAGTAIFAILTTAGAARGQEAPEPLAVVYEAPDGCPTSDAFFREVIARTTRARAARLGERARIMHVVVTRQGQEHAGRLWIEDANGSSTARSVSSNTCREVVGALALIGALAVDPRASTAPIAATPLTTASAEAPAAVGTNTPPSGGRPPAPAPPPPTERDREASAAPRSAASPESPIRATAGLQIEMAFVADAVPSGRVFGELAIGPRDRVFALAIRLAIARSLDVERRAAIGGATLHWTSVGLDLCPLRFALARPLALIPCATGSAGVLNASGTGIAASVDRSRPWATAGALGRVVWEPLGWLAVEAEAGVIAPLYRESFFFGPNVSVYQAPAAAFLSRAALGVHFW